MPCILEKNIFECVIYLLMEFILLRSYILFPNFSFLFHFLYYNFLFLFFVVVFSSLPT